MELAGMAALSGRGIVLFFDQVSNKFGRVRKAKFDTRREYRVLGESKVLAVIRKGEIIRKGDMERGKLYPLYS